jgi:hypothetical protein
MSSPDPVGDGTFELLDSLPAKPRQLYIEKLSKKELLSIVNGVWEERDEKGAQVKRRRMPDNARNNDTPTMSANDARSSLPGM